MFKRICAKERNVGRLELLGRKALRFGINTIFKNSFHFYVLFLFIYFFKDFLYLFDREREYKQAERQAEGEGEAGSPLSREPNAGLNPRTLGITTRAAGSRLTD